MPAAPAPAARDRSSAPRASAGRLLVDRNEFDATQERLALLAHLRARRGRSSALRVPDVHEVPARLRMQAQEAEFLLEQRLPLGERSAPVLQLETVAHAFRRGTGDGNELLLDQLVAARIDRARLELPGECHELLRRSRTARENAGKRDRHERMRAGLDLLAEYHVVGVAAADIPGRSR